MFPDGPGNLDYVDAEDGVSFSSVFFCCEVQYNKFRAVFRIRIQLGPYPGGPNFPLKIEKLRNIMFYNVGWFLLRAEVAMAKLR